MIEFAFVLVAPEDDRNIGAAARALNTMGHQHLRLVNPKVDHLSGKALALAHGSHRILETAQLHSTLSDALQDMDLAIATTARHRMVQHHYISTRDLPQRLQSIGSSLKRVAVVFGCESSGLQNQDIDQCDLLSTIPQACLHPSLNLAQAVMIYSYTLAEAKTTLQIEDQRLQDGEMPPEEYHRLKASTLALMKRVGLHERDQTYVTKALARLGWADLYLVQSIRSRVEALLDRLEGDCRASDRPEYKPPKQKVPEQKAPKDKLVKDKLSEHNTNLDLDL